MTLRSRSILTTAVVLGVCGLSPAVASATATPASTPASTPAVEAAYGGGVPVPAHGAYAGAAVNVQGDQNWQDAFTGFEAQSRRSLAVHRMYQSWTADPVIGLTRWDVQNGKIPALSIDSPPWAQVANGSEDAQIVKQAQGFKALGAPVMLSFNHEPDLDGAALGTPAEYAAAWRHWVDIYRQQGVTNVSFTWILMASSFARGGAVANSYYPGDGYVDWIGVDGYNWYNACKDLPWTSFGDVFAGFRSWTISHPKPLFIAEVGSAEDSAAPQRKAQWMADMGTTLKSWPEVKAVAWFNWYPKAGTTDCQVRVVTSQPSIDGWAQTVADPYLDRTLANTPASSPPVLTAPTVAADPISLPPGAKPSVTSRVTSPDASATVHVEYGPTTAYGTSSLDSIVPATADPFTVTSSLASMAPLSTYHYRVVATSRGGTTTTPDAVVRVPGKPTSSTQAATQVLGTTATFAGSVVSNGLPTTVSFQYGPSTGYGQNTAAISVAAGWTPQSISQPVTGLNPGWTYHVRLRSTSSAGTTTGPDVVVQTAALPKVDTWLVGARTTSSITARGSVVPGRLATTYSYQYGTTTAYGSSSPTASLAPGSTAVAVPVVLGGLPKGTAYHYRVVATNGAGTSYGPDKTGSTLS